MKPRVFISSVVERYHEFRDAARQGVLAAGGEPVLVNEDFPARPISSRNVCLDAVDSSDVYVALLGERGGWTAPSGKLVVEEEYDRARERRMPLLVFVQRVERDPDSTRLLNRVSDYVEATFRREFSNASELRAEVERALRPLITSIQQPPMDPQIMLERLRRRSAPNQFARLRFVLAPVRDEEVVDLLEFGTREFLSRTQEIAHRSDIDLFDYGAAKSVTVARDAITIVQEPVRRREGGISGKKLTVMANGLLDIESELDGGESGGPLGFGGLMILRSNVERVLWTAFRFACAWYAERDAFKRHQEFLYGVALAGLQYRKWVDSAPTGNSITMGVGQVADPYLVYNLPRLVGRRDVESPEAEIGRITALASRDLT